MKEHVKTYGVVINMDYAHYPVTTCKKLWHKIEEKMLVHDFRFEKRMFMIKTHYAKENVYSKAKTLLDDVDIDMSVDKDSVFHYLKDFYTLDITEYVDLRFPNTKLGIELQEHVVEEIILN